MTAEPKSSDERSRLLEKLHSIVFAAFLTYLPTEYCLEVVTMTSRGTACYWIAEDDWRVYELHKIDPIRWDLIVASTKRGALIRDDIKGTDLEELVNSLFPQQTNCSAIMKRLCELQNAPEGNWYCYCDPDEGELYFYYTHDDLAHKLAEVYSRVDSTWEAFEDESLEGFLSRYNEEGKAIPCCWFADEEE